MRKVWDHQNYLGFIVSDLLHCISQFYILNANNVYLSSALFFLPKCNPWYITQPHLLSNFHKHQGFINFFNHYLIGGVSEPLSSNFNEELLALLPILERGPPLGTLASDSDTE
jgi:hypothetical protein